MRCPAPRSFFLATALSLLLGASLTGAAIARAPVDLPGINRCVAADGTAVFTDRPCDTMDARPVVPPPASGDAVPDGMAVARDCARTPQAFREALRAALASGDGNRVAALYDWRGRSSGSAAGLMPRLEALAAGVAPDVTLGHSAEGSADAGLASEARAAPPDRVRVSTVGDAREFDLVRAAGCWLFRE